MNTQIAEKPPASPAANPNPNPSSRRRTYQGAGKREPYRIAATAGREAMMRLGVACAQMVAEGRKPKPSWWPVLAYIIAGEEGITAYSRTCDEVSIRNMARWTVLSRNTVKAAMSDLQAMGIIKYETVGAVKGQRRAIPARRHPPHKVPVEHVDRNAPRNVAELAVRSRLALHRQR
jgi:hypothetical protein